MSSKIISLVNPASRVKAQETDTLPRFRKASEHPLYRIEKKPALRQKQGQFAVVAPGGLILKRGHDLKTVLRVFDKMRFRVTK